MIDAASAPARLREVEVPPTKNSTPAVSAKSITSSCQAGKTGTTRAAGSPTRTNTVPARSMMLVAVTLASHRPSKPAPAPNANKALAARTRPGVGCAHESSFRPRISSSRYGRATCRRATAGILASHGARDVNLGPTRRNTDRYVARDRSSANPTATKRSTVSGSSTTSTSSGRPSPTAHAASQAKTRTTRRAPGPSSASSRSMQPATNANTTGQRSTLMACGR